MTSGPLLFVVTSRNRDVHVGCCTGVSVQSHRKSTVDPAEFEDVADSSCGSLVEPELPVGLRRIDVGADDDPLLHGSILPCPTEASVVTNQKVSSSDIRSRSRIAAFDRLTIALMNALPRSFDGSSVPEMTAT